MATDLRIHLGEPLDTFGTRFAAAWRRSETGELAHAEVERHVSFENFATFVSIMSPKRLELLRHLHRHPTPSIRALAGALGRDYRRVHDDVEALSGAGLIDRRPDGLWADYDTLRIDAVVAI